MSKDDVLKALAQCAGIDNADMTYKSCDGCPLGFTDGRATCQPFDEDNNSEIPVELIHRAVELMGQKENGVKAKISGKINTYGSWWYVCGACGEAIDFQDPFCRYCGVPVDWEEEKRDG